MALDSTSPSAGATTLVNVSAGDADAMVRREAQARPGGRSGGRGQPRRCRSVLGEGTVVRWGQRRDTGGGARQEMTLASAERTMAAQKGGAAQPASSPVSKHIL